MAAKGNVFLLFKVKSLPELSTECHKVYAGAPAPAWKIFPCLKSFRESFLTGTPFRLLLLGQAGYWKMSCMSLKACNEFFRAEVVSWTAALAVSTVVTFLVQHFRSSLISVACAPERKNGLPCSLTLFSFVGTCMLYVDESELFLHGTDRTSVKWNKLNAGSMFMLVNNMETL